MSFRNRFLALQWCCVFGLATIAIGLILLLPFAPGHASSRTIHSLLALGFACSISSSLLLSRMLCPRCKKPFCGPPQDETPPSSIFTSRCKFCGFRPE